MSDNRTETNEATAGDDREQVAQHILQEGTICGLRGTVQEDSRLRYATQSGTQFKTYELFISGTFYLIFLDCSCLQVTETKESETLDKGKLL